MTPSSVSSNDSRANIVPLSSTTPINDNGDKTDPPLPSFGPKSVNPKSRKIQDAWTQSVEKLNAEIKDLRDAMSKLLDDIRALIKDYKNDKHLTALMDALASAGTSVSRAFSDTAHVDHMIRQIDYQALSPDIAVKVKKAIEEFHRSINQSRALSGNESRAVVNAPQQKSKAPTNENDKSAIVSDARVDDTLEHSEATFRDNTRFIKKFRSEESINDEELRHEPNISGGGDESDADLLDSPRS